MRRFQRTRSFRPEMRSDLNVALSDLPKSLQISEEEARVACEFLEKLSGRQFGEVAGILGAVLFAIGVGNAYVDGQRRPAPGSGEVITAVEEQLMIHSPDAVWTIPGSILIRVSQIAKGLR